MRLISDRPFALEGLCKWLSVLLLATLVPSRAFAQTVPLPPIQSLSGICAEDIKGIPARGPGTAVLIARRGELICAAARGMASIELGVPLDPHQRFRIGSVSKQFAAAALLKLVDQGRASIDDPLAKYLPDYPNAGQITLHQLLNHTSGVHSYTDIDGYMHTPVRSDLDTQQLIRVFADIPLDFAPGSEWKYSNSGYVLVGAVIEKITGKPWGAALDELLFKPLKLADTAYEDPSRLWPGLVQGYVFDAQHAPQPAEFISMTQPGAAGALISTVYDLWRWNEALHGGGVLSQSSYHLMTTPEGAASGSARYGFGISVRSVRGRTCFEHAGGINGFRARLVYLPESGTTVVQLNNHEDTAKAAHELAARAIGDPYPELPLVAWSEQSLQATQGRYANEDANAKLSYREGRLYWQQQGSADVELRPSSGERLAFVDSVDWMKLERDDKGKLIGVRVFAGGEGPGVLLLRLADVPLK
jgi:CubicO group peptidase (beta-lactamase class C family)